MLWLLLLELLLLLGLLLLLLKHLTLENGLLSGRRADRVEMIKHVGIGVRAKKKAR